MLIIYQCKSLIGTLRELVIILQKLIIIDSIILLNQNKIES